MRPAALLGWAYERAEDRVRGRTVSAEWSPGSRKVKKRGRDSRICPRKTCENSLFYGQRAPPRKLGREARV